MTHRPDRGNGPRFDGRVVIVTGGGAGIGRAIAHRVAVEGGRVAIIDWDADSGRETADQIVRNGGVAVAHEADISDPDRLTAAFGAVRSSLGAVDVLVNNAAVARSDGLLDTTWEEWRRDIDVVLGGPFLCTRAALPDLTRGRGGVIINIASVNALSAIDSDAYSAAKAGVISLTRMTATRYGRQGVRAVAVAPGTVATDETAWRQRVSNNPQLFETLLQWYPLGRLGSPEDIANLVAFLASDEASWMTGNTVEIDGGLLAGNESMMRLLAQAD